MNRRVFLENNLPDITLNLSNSTKHTIQKIQYTLEQKKTLKNETHGFDEWWVHVSS